MPRKDSVGKDKTREWERERRERLNECFNHLGVLLPDYDPAVVTSKVDILSKAASYIRNLQQENRNLLNGGLDESNLSQLKQLKRRVEELVKRTQQLAALLRDAGISIPSEVGTIAPRANQWTNKIRAEDAAELLDRVRKKRVDDKKQRIAQRKKKTPASTKKRPSTVTGKTPLVSTSNIPSAKPKKKTAKKSKKMAAIAKKPTVSQMLGLSSADLEVDLPNPSQQFIVLPSSSANTKTSSCIVVTNPKPSLSNLSLMLNQNVISTPIMTSRIVKTNQSESIMKMNPSLASLGPGTLILANGDIVPVLPQIQPSLVKDKGKLAAEKAKVVSQKAKKGLSKLVPKPRKRDISKLALGKVAIPPVKRFLSESLAEKLGAAVKPKKKVGKKVVVVKVDETVAASKTRAVEVTNVLLENVVSNNLNEPKTISSDDISKTAETTVDSLEVVEKNVTEAVETTVEESENSCKRRLEDSSVGEPKPKSAKLDLVKPDEIIDPNSALNTMSPIEAIRNVISSSTAIKTSNSGSYTIDALCKMKIPIEKVVEKHVEANEKAISDEVVVENQESPVVSLPSNDVVTDTLQETTKDANPSENISTVTETSVNSPIPIPDKETFSPDKDTFAPDIAAKSHVKEIATSTTSTTSSMAYNKDKPIYSQSKITTNFSDNIFFKSTNYPPPYSNYDSGNTFIPISDADSVNVHSSLSLAIQNHEFSNDIFASLQVPTGGHHPESISPTAAFLLAFPLVSTSKVTEMIDSQEEAGSDSLQGTSTLLQIGNLDSEQSIISCVRREGKEYNVKSSENEKIPELGFVDCVAKKPIVAPPNPKSNIFEFDNNCYPGVIPPISEAFLPSISSIPKYQDKQKYQETKATNICDKPNFVKTSNYSQIMTSVANVQTPSTPFREERNPFLTHLNPTSSSNEIPISLNQPCSMFNAVGDGSAEIQRSNYKSAEKCGNVPFYSQSNTQTYNYNLFHSSDNPVITSSSSNYSNVDKNIFHNLPPEKQSNLFTSLPNVSQSVTMEKASNPFQSGHNMSQITAPKEAARKELPFHHQVSQNSIGKTANSFRVSQNLPQINEKTNPFQPQISTAAEKPPNNFQISQNPSGIQPWTSNLPPTSTNTSTNQNQFATFNSQVSRPQNKTVPETYSKNIEVHVQKSDCFTNIFNNERQPSSSTQFTRSDHHTAYKYPADKNQTFVNETELKNNQATFKTNQNNHRPPVNWMTTPDSRQQTFAANQTTNNPLLPESPQKQFDLWPNQNILNNVAPNFDSRNFNNTFYGNNFYPSNGSTCQNDLNIEQNVPQQKLPDLSETESYPFNWNSSPRKATTLGDSVFVPSTLPTLVGDLALGTNFASGLDDHQKTFVPNYDPEKDSTKTKEKDPKRKPPQEYPLHFLSVSQLVDQAKCVSTTSTTSTTTTVRGQNRRNVRNVMTKPSRTNNKRPIEEESSILARKIDYQRDKDVNRNVFETNTATPTYQTFREQQNWPNPSAKQRTPNYKAPVSNYSAEALIGSGNAHQSKPREPTKVVSLPPPMVSERFSHQSCTQPRANPFSAPELGYYPNVEPQTDQTANFQNQNYSNFTSSSQSTQFYPTSNYIPCATPNSSTFLPEIPSNSYPASGLPTNSYPDGTNFMLPLRGRALRPAQFPAQRGARRMPVGCAKKPRRRDANFPPPENCFPMARSTQLATSSPTSNVSSGNSLANFNLSTIFPEINDKQSAVPAFGKNHMSSLPTPSHPPSLPPPHNMSTITTAGHMSSLAPPGHMSSLPPPGHMSSLPPPGHMSSLPPPGHMSSLAPPRHMSSLPAAGHMGTLPTPEPFGHSVPQPNRVQWS